MTKLDKLGLGDYWYTWDKATDATRLCTSEVELRESWKMENRRVAYHKFTGGTWVSTVFLNTDHASGGVAPALFETCLFPAVGDSMVIERYATGAAAQRGHDRVVSDLLASGLQVEVAQ